MQNLLLENVSFPMTGLGTDKLKKEDLIQGLKNGFQLIDTAQAYENEELVGSAIKESGIPLSYIKVITKLSRPHLENKKKLRESIRKSVEKIGKIPEVILIHAPYPDIPMVSLAEELESMKKEGALKNWGVSNFDIEHLSFLIKNGLYPSLNQVEYHPFFQRHSLLKYCKEHGVILQAYRPLAQGKALEHPTIQEMAKSHGISEAKLIYAWFAQQGIPIVTKISSKDHQKECVDSGQLSLSNREMMAISQLHDLEGQGRTCTKGGWHVPFTKEIRDKWFENYH